MLRERRDVHRQGAHLKTYNVNLIASHDQACPSSAYTIPMVHGQVTPVRLHDAGAFHLVCTEGGVISCLGPEISVDEHSYDTIANQLSDASMYGPSRRR